MWIDYTWCSIHKDTWCLLLLVFDKTTNQRLWLLTTRLYYSEHIKITALLMQIFTQLTGDYWWLPGQTLWRWTAVWAAIKNAASCLENGSRIKGVLTSLTLNVCVLSVLHEHWPVVLTGLLFLFFFLANGSRFARFLFFYQLSVIYQLITVSAVCPLLWFNLKVLSLPSFLCILLQKWVQYVRQNQVLQKEDIWYDDSSSSSFFNTDWSRFFRNSSPGFLKDIEDSLDAGLPFIKFSVNTLLYWSLWRRVLDR